MDRYVASGVATLATTRTALSSPNANAKPPSSQDLSTGRGLPRHSSSAPRVSFIPCARASSETLTRLLSAKRPPELELGRVLRSVNAVRVTLWRLLAADRPGACSCLGVEQGCAVVLLGLGRLGGVA